MDHSKTEMAVLDHNNNKITGVQNFAIKLTKGKSAIKLLHKLAEQLISTSGIETNKLVGFGISMPGLVDSNAGKNYTYPADRTCNSINHLPQSNFTLK